MTTEQETEPTGPTASRPRERQPDWWHRDHPTFTALTGFFTGLAFVIAGARACSSRCCTLLVDDDTAEELFPFVLVTLVVPIGLVIAPRTRRFGIYMLIGMVVTALVVGGRRRAGALVHGHATTAERARESSATAPGGRIGHDV